MKLSLKRDVLTDKSLDHGKEFEFNISSRWNHGYPLNTSSAHSPVKAMLFVSDISLQKYIKEDSISAIHGASLISTVSFKYLICPELSQVRYLWLEFKYFLIIST